MAHIYDVGTRAWQPDEKEGWVASEVSDKVIEGDKVKLIFQLEDGSVCKPTPRHMAMEESVLRALADNAGRRVKLL
jgi:myosin heavy subunit